MIHEEGRLLAAADLIVEGSAFGWIYVFALVVDILLVDNTNTSLLDTTPSGVLSIIKNERRQY